MTPQPPTLALLLAILLALAATLLALALWHAPTRLRCPHCRARTAALVTPRWLRILAPMVASRWCMSCSWTGLALKAPRWAPRRRPVGRRRFQWRSPSAPRRIHAYGFRWRQPRHARDDAPRRS